MQYKPQELSIWVEYFDGQETYRIKTSISPELIFSGINLRKTAAYAAENMMHKLEKDLFDRA